MLNILVFTLVGCGLPGSSRSDSPATDSAGPPSETGSAGDSHSDGDSGPAESGLPDSAPPESGAPESGAPETGTPETGDDDERDWPITRELTCYTAVADYASGGPAIWEFDLATGTRTRAVPLSGETSDVYDISSLGKEGDMLYSCNGATETFVTFDLIWGEVTHPPTPCDAAAQWEGASPTAGGVVLLDLYGIQMLYYADLDAATSNDATSRFADYPSSISRITISDDTLYGVWHSTDEFEVMDLNTGAMHTVALEGYDDWIWGLEVVDGMLLVLDYYGTLHAFDPDTGEALGEQRIEHDDYGQYLYGLTCETEAVTE